MDMRLLAAYHEAGHVVAAWMCGLPVGKVKIDHKGQGLTRLSLWYRSTTMFRPVNQETVRKSALFALAGDYSEQLVSLRVAKCSGDDMFLVSFLSRRFCLDYADLRRETEFMILRQRRTIALLAEQLYQLSVLDEYQLALHRMNWLACGRT